jgi:hypothetical protein
MAPEKRKLGRRRRFKRNRCARTRSRTRAAGRGATSGGADFARRVEMALLPAFVGQ